MEKTTDNVITNINLGETNPIKLIISAKTNTAIHWHPYIELIYILSGEMNITIRDREYKLRQDDILVINPFTMHSYQTSGCVIAFFKIHHTMYDRSIISRLRMQFDCNSSISEDKGRFFKLKQLLARLIKANTDNFPNSQILNKSFSYNILYELINNFSVEIENDDSGAPQGFFRMEEILEYINSHYNEKISLGTIAEHTFLTEPYLSRLFKKNLGINFSEYLTSIRLSHATRDLLTTSASIEEISERCGFPNTRSFSTAFREEYGMLPGIYRKNQDVVEPILKSDDKNTPTLINYSHHNYLGTLAKYLDEETNEVPQTKFSRKNVLQSQNVNAKGSILKHNFKKTTSIGKAKHILYAKNQEMLRELQKDIGFEFIKFHGILDDDMMIYSENAQGETELSFTYIDMVIDFLLSINLRPIIQLSFMPKDLAESTVRKMFYSESIISFPKSMEKWNYLIKNFVKHLEIRYGASKVESWLFSLWNEPDSGEVLFGVEDRNRFFDFYKNTHNTIKSVNRNIRFGSPSLMFSSMNSGDWVSDFMDFCKENKCLPEFFNFHFYPISINEVSIPESQFRPCLLLDKSENALSEGITGIRKNIKDNNWNIDKVYMTEWNSTVSHRDWLNDTVFKSAYITKNILENYDRLESFGYWFLSDFMEELKMAGEIFHGGLGLFTFNGIKKSHYYAFKIMSSLGDTLLGRGDGFFLTRSKNGYEFVFYNYQHFSELYATGELFDMTFENRYTPFINPTNKFFELPLTGLENTTYIIKETIINRDYGSSFDKWIECGAMPLETEEEFENLKSISVPQIQKRKVIVENGCFTLTAELKPHEVRGISIYRALE